MPGQPAPPPLTQRSGSGLQVKLPARCGTEPNYVIRGSVDVGDSVSDRSGPHDVDAIPPEQRGEHIDDIVVVVHNEAGHTGQFTKFARRPMRPARKHHPDPCERFRRAAIGMTRPFEDFSTAAARARRQPSAASWSRKASTVLSMNLSTSSPINSASSSAATNTRGLTQKAHRREFSYPIHRIGVQPARHSLNTVTRSRGKISGQSSRYDGTRSVERRGRRSRNRLLCEPGMFRMREANHHV